MYRFKLEKGFTLIELLIVISIIALAGSIVLPNMWKQLDASKASAEKQQLIKLVNFTKTKSYFTNQTFIIELSGKHVKVLNSKGETQKSILFNNLTCEEAKVTLSKKSNLKEIYLDCLYLDKSISVEI
ncbi:prepilin-type N-terminal cleavage/methylation domain-containing protein [Pseudoalteromonas shioyasakiensis]|uniref:type II secretion system protein n=1 Tax=Pseudoalteromonas shioyasakiensis TaxID=1190813 RepID=UPI002094C6E9|nr:type II secretion system protein [Pseudoalteromonas shioyasakiensis]MCO6356666.1 prepilin-type N-terminal cleavage/methylation domain-containing protein [Pseudoalteromonas shioyasakiensis]